MENVQETRQAGREDGGGDHLGAFEDIYGTERSSFPTSTASRMPRKAPAETRVCERIDALGTIEGSEGGGDEMGSRAVAVAGESGGIDSPRNVQCHRPAYYRSSPPIHPARHISQHIDQELGCEGGGCDCARSFARGEPWQACDGDSDEGSDPKTVEFRPSPDTSRRASSQGEAVEDGIRGAIRDRSMVCVSELPDVCAICLGKYSAGERVHVLPCLHIFHAEVTKKQENCLSEGRDSGTEFYFSRAFLQPLSTDVSRRAYHAFFHIRTRNPPPSPLQCNSPAFCILAPNGTWQCLDVWIVSHPSCPYCKEDLNILPPECEVNVRRDSARRYALHFVSIAEWPLEWFREHLVQGRERMRADVGAAPTGMVADATLGL